MSNDDQYWTLENVPIGARNDEDESLFRGASNNTLIVPDRVSPAVEGYFRIPAIWVGEAPAPETVEILNPIIHHEKVLSKDLACGIRVKVQRDGLFLFDFSRWRPAPLVIIPGYRKPNASGPYRPLPANSRAEAKAEEHAIIRAQVMNAHQACLTSAERFVENRSAAMAFPVTAWNTHKALSFEAPPSYYDDSESIHALAHNVLNNKDRIQRPNAIDRRVIELNVVDYYFKLLDKILSDANSGLAQLVKAAYIASCRNGEKRFGEALTLAWGVCEQLVSSEWRKILDEKNYRSENTMTKDRRKKLMGRDYTASVMIEMLEISGKIDRELYRKLEIARKARNYWMHEMRQPKEREVYICLEAVQSMLQGAKGVELSLQSSGRGGFPQWPYWMWEQIKDR